MMWCGGGFIISAVRSMEQVNGETRVTHVKSRAHDLVCS